MTKYYHHGICIDGNTVISFYDDSKVRLQTVKEFAAGEVISVENTGGSREAREATASRAEEYYKDQNFGTYSIAMNNCEHFATACVGGPGKRESKQVKDVLIRGAQGALKEMTRKRTSAEANSSLESLARVLTGAFLG